MGVREIPKKFVLSCDGCDVEAIQETSARPPHWSELTLAQHAYDYQGGAVGDATVHHLLCRACTAAMAAHIERVVNHGKR